MRPSKGGHLEWVRTGRPTYIPHGQAPRFPHRWLKYPVHPDTPAIIGWIIGGLVH
jgi:hypothetical protein